VDYTSLTNFTGGGEGVKKCNSCLDFRLLWVLSRLRFETVQISAIFLHCGWIASNYNALQLSYFPAAYNKHILSYKKTINVSDNDGVASQAQICGVPYSQGKRRLERCVVKRLWKTDRQWWCWREMLRQTIANASSGNGKSSDPDSNIYSRVHTADNQRRWLASLYRMHSISVISRSYIYYSC